ncbi:MAG: hypothetical protein JO013_01185 [Alphaproteobacteria bacterium]|nr:hypothetical protein [Alphaproteobacteria bacterium]
MIFAPLAVLLAQAINPEPTGLLRSDDTNYWLPGAKLVAMVERRLGVPDRMGGPLSNFNRYYTGLYRNGHRVLFLELSKFGALPAGSGKVQVVPPAQVPHIIHGGCDIIRFSYDVDARQESSLDCNFDPPPPPPQPHQ